MHGLLTKAGIDTFLDVKRMRGQFSKVMQDEIAGRDFVLLICTPRLKKRAEEPPEKNNLLFELEQVAAKLVTSPHCLINMIFEGDFQLSMPNLPGVIDLPAHMTYRCEDDDKCLDTLLRTDTPLGLLPALLRLEDDSDSFDEYKAYYELYKNKLQEVRRIQAAAAKAVKEKHARH